MECLHFESIDSTNKYLKDNHKNLENFTFVSSDYQTDGKGREERVWNSNKNENLLFSYLIKEKDLLKKFKSLSIGTATLIARFLELKGIKNVTVKWPNDVYINDKKICGILLEGNINEFVVVGVGLNVNQNNFVGDFRIVPTSMKIELNKTLSLNELEVELFEFIFKHINQTKFEQNTLKFFESHNYLLNKKIKAKNFIGKCNGISSDFGLKMDDQIIYSNEIEIL